MSISACCTSRARLDGLHPFPSSGAVAHVSVSVALVGLDIGLEMVASVMIPPAGNAFRPLSLSLTTPDTTAVQTNWDLQLL